MSKEICGVCKLCGKQKRLTFEHLPPQKAFNSFSVKVFPPEEVLKLMSGKDGRKPWETNGLKGQIQQGGSGDFFLCKECNNKTGAWYAREYVEFTRKIHLHLSQCEGISPRKACSLVLQDIYPLRVLKSIMVMFCDIYEDCFGDEDLRSFLLDKKSMAFNPEKYSLYIYFTKGPFLRKLPLQHRFMPGYGFVHVSEISHYPLGLLLFINKPKDFQPQGTNITSFCQYDYDYSCNYHFFGVPFLEVNTSLVLDYRSKKEVLMDEEKLALVLPSKQ